MKRRKYYQIYTLNLSLIIIALLLVINVGESVIIANIAALRIPGIKYFIPKINLNSKSSGGNSHLPPWPTNQPTLSIERKKEKLKSSKALSLYMCSKTKSSVLSGKVGSAYPNGQKQTRGLKKCLKYSEAFFEGLVN